MDVPQRVDGRIGVGQVANGQGRQPMTGCQSGRSTVTPAVDGTRVREVPVGSDSTAIEVWLRSLLNRW
jgi:hypothetical protein